MKDKILITGHSGMVAGRLIEMLNGQYDICTLTTNKSKSDGQTVFYWNTETGEMDNNAVEGIKGIIHLSGFPVDARWTENNKKLMRLSRVKAGEMLLRACAEKGIRPEFVISSSAIGYYGYGRQGKMDEYKLSGSGFIADLCEAWENAALSFETIGSRVVICRTSLVLSKEGGFLARMKPIYKLGLGAGLGSGKQPMPWIHIDDLCGFIIQSISDSTIEGPYNMCTSEKINLNEFGKILAKKMDKPYFMPNVPAFVLKLVFGDRSQLFLNTPNVTNLRLADSGYPLKYNKLEKALENLL